MRAQDQRHLKQSGLIYFLGNAMQGMNSVVLFLLRTAEREDVTFWLLDALATAVIPGHWEKLFHISAPDTKTVTIR